MAAPALIQKRGQLFLFRLFQGPDHAVIAAKLPYSVHNAAPMQAQNETVAAYSFPRRCV